MVTWHPATQLTQRPSDRMVKQALGLLTLDRCPSLAVWRSCKITGAQFVGKELGFSIGGTTAPRPQDPLAIVDHLACSDSAGSSINLIRPIAGLQEIVGPTRLVVQILQRPPDPPAETGWVPGAHVISLLCS